MMLRVTAHHDTFMQELFNLVVQRGDAVLQAAAGRTLVAAAPGLACMPTLQQSLFMELLTQVSPDSSVQRRLVPTASAASSSLLHLSSAQATQLTAANGGGRVHSQSAPSAPIFA